MVCESLAKKEIEDLKERLNWYEDVSSFSEPADQKSSPEDTAVSLHESLLEDTTTSVQTSTDNPQVPLTLTKAVPEQQ
ncbi:hypothetical protein ACFX13_028977 [Malus domestica]